MRHASICFSRPVFQSEVLYGHAKLKPVVSRTQKTVIQRNPTPMRKKKEEEPVVAELKARGERLAGFTEGVAALSHPPTLNPLEGAKNSICRSIARAQRASG